MPEPVNVVYCYAHTDRVLMERLDGHFAMLRRNREIRVWKDTDIVPGRPVAREVLAHIDQAKLILLLVSADFLASDFHYTQEMARAMERQERGEAYVVPVILSPCLWEKAPFGHLKPLPENGSPVKKWSDPDAAFLDIVQGIDRLVQELRLLEEGTAARNSRQFENALAAYSAAAQLNPSSAIAHKGLGDTFAQMSRPQEAEAAYLRASRINPHLLPPPPSALPVTRPTSSFPSELQSYLPSDPSLLPERPVFTSSPDAPSRKPRLPRRRVVIGLGLVGLVSVVGVGLYNAAHALFPTAASATPTPSSASTVSAKPSPQASSTGLSPSASPAVPPARVTRYNGVLMSKTANQSSKMDLQITSRSQQKGTIEGVLTVEPPLADRGGHVYGLINGNGYITQFSVVSTVSPYLTFTIEQRQGNSYNGQYYGQTYAGVLENGQWEMNQA